MTDKSSNSDNNKSTNNQDFISFCSPPQTRFDPSNCSSPVRNNGYRGKQGNKRFSSTFNNSQNSYSHPYNRSFNNSRNNSWSRNNHMNSNHSNRSQDISSFLHPSFMENPWEKLEKDHKKKLMN